MRPLARRDRGSILAIACILIILIMGMAVALLKAAATNTKSTITGEQWDQALDVAEAGTDYTISAMNTWKSGSLSTVSLTFGPGNSAVVAITPTFSGAAGTYSLRSTGTVGRVGGLLGTSHTITVVVKSTSGGMFGYGMFGITGVTMSGDVLTDGYSSAKGSYLSQQVNYDPVHKEHYADPLGSVGSNGNITASGGTTVYGPATPGVAPTYSYSGSGGAYVAGSTASEPSPVALPPAPYTPSPAASAGSYRPGTTTITAGSYHYSDFVTSGSDKVTFTGNVTLYIDGKIDVSGSSVLNLAADAKVVIYQGGGGAVHITGGGVVNPSNLPADFQVYSTNDTSRNPSYDVQFSGGTNLFGTLYAPKAVFKPSGGTQFYGSFVASYIDDSGGATFHYDESLSGLGGTPLYQTVAWFENPADQ